MPRVRIAAVLLAAAMVAGCGGASSTSSATATPTPSPTVVATPLITASPISFGRCATTGAPATAACGLLRVPLDYSDSSRGTIAINVLKLPATDPVHRIGSLLVNPGGPGASGVQFAVDESQMLTSLNQRFDIVGFDPRGTGGPDVVSCVGTAQLDHLVAIDPIVDDPAEKQDLVDSSRAFATACQQQSGRLLPYLGTENVARDMDQLRAALGDAKLTYLGISYGTEIGARYARMFPTHIRAMVLDGAVDLSVPLLDAVAQQSDGLEQGLTAFVAQCKARPQCGLNPDPLHAIESLIAAIDAHPVLVKGRSYGRGEGLVALVAAMYGPEAWDTIASFFALAQQGNFAGLQELTDLYTGRSTSAFDNESGYDHQMESGTAVSCADSAVPADLATYDARAATVQARDRHFGDAAIYGILPCAYWPVHGAVAAPVDVVGAPPILVVGGTGDPATPYVWAEAVHRQIQGSILLTRTGFGHPSYNHSACVAARVDSYLETLQAPADSLRCASS